MTTTPPTVREGLTEASDFARDVWRDCWAVMLVIVIGRTLVFMGHHLSETEWRHWLWPGIGEFLSLAYIPLFGALYRLGVGGKALDSLGWGGFQWTSIEWRLLSVWAVLGFALSLCAAPLAIVSFPLLYLFQHHAAVSLGPFGGWSLASILLAPFWLAFAAFVLFMWGRLGLAAATTTARGRISPFSSWGLTRGLGWTIGLAWLITQLPMVFGWIGLCAMGLAEAGDISSGPVEIWPMTDAVIAGGVVAILAVVIQAPLSVGLLSGLHRWLSEDASQAADISSPLVQDYAPAIEQEPARVDEPIVPAETERALSVWPHTVLPRNPFRPRAEAANDLAFHEVDAPASEPEETLEHAPETPPAPEAPPVVEEMSAEHLYGRTEIETAPADPEPPLASTSEAGQTSPDDTEPHA